MTALLLVLVGLLGLAVGSFLNVVVWRVPQGMSVVSPPSACPVCGHAIRPRDNVPVLSWLVLRGRCRDCRAPISVRYPLVEVGTAVAFVVVALHFGASWTLPAFLYLAAVGIALALIDLDTFRLPDALVLPSYPVVAVLLVLASVNPGGTSDWWALARGAIGAVTLAAFYLVAWWFGGGLGDVKLAGVLGLATAWLGWGPFLVGTFAAYLLGSVATVPLYFVVLARRLRRRLRGESSTVQEDAADRAADAAPQASVREAADDGAGDHAGDDSETTDEPEDDDAGERIGNIRWIGRKTKIPFGPSMLLGAVIGIGWGQQLWDSLLGVGR